MTSLHSTRSRFSLLLLLALTACGGGGGGGGSQVGPVDVHLTDAVADELLSFTVGVQALRFVGPAGAGENLLAGEVSVELLGLSGSQRWLVREDGLAPGPYTAVRLELVPESIVARDKSGTAVPVNVVSTVLDAPFPSPVTLGSGGDLQALVDFDLASSITGSVSAPPLRFEPRGSSVGQDTSSSTSIDEIRGVVLSTDSANRQLVIDAFADEDRLVSLGPVTVEIEAPTLLLDEGGLTYPDTSAFFADLVVGTTLVEVHGLVRNQRVLATRIEIEDRQGGGTGEDRVKIEGLIHNLDSASMTFDLLIVEVERGHSIVEPVLDALGRPTSIPVGWTPSTIFFRDDDQIATDSILSEGARVKARFAVFTTTPFVATRIELEDGPEFEGRIVDVSGLPDSIVIHLDDDEPAITSGQVQGPSTPVTVTLSGSDIFLDTENEPQLLPGALLVGLKIEAQSATLSGPPDGPTVTPTRTKIFPGRFRGVVNSISRSIPSFNASMTELRDPFGNSVDFGPVTVVIAEDCHFEDEASTREAFFALFEGLDAGEVLEVEVFGIGTGVEHEILAHEIEAEVVEL